MQIQKERLHLINRAIIKVTVLVKGQSLEAEIGEGGPHMGLETIRKVGTGE